MIKQLLNFLFPPKCIICDDYGAVTDVCSQCWGKFTFLSKPYCSICSYPFAYENDEKAICGYCIMNKPKYDRAISLLKYDNHSKRLIHKFKYQDQLHILDYFVDLLLNLGKEVIDQADVIVPVAMHQYKLLKRGYNQAALLAMRIAAKRKILYLPQLLIKKQNSTAQAGLDKMQREKNIKNSFKLNAQYSQQIINKKVLLIDDVMTTGATINECCKMLSAAKPSKIFVLTLAKRV